jgi:hypothetical protein
VVAIVEPDRKFALNISMTCCEDDITPKGKYVSILSNALYNDVLIDDDIKACDDDSDALIIETSISVAITDKELLNDALTISIID